MLALSSDSQEKAKETAEKDGLQFPVAHSLEVPDDAERIGAYWEKKRGIVQPSEFLLGPDRRVLHATYSTGPIGRIDPADALTLIRFLKARK